MLDRDSLSNTTTILLGAVTSATVGSVLFQAIGALILGLLGAVGGYLFNRFIRHRLDKFLDKRSKKDKLEA